MTTTFAQADDLGLFETVDLLPALVLPNNLYAMQEAAIQRGEGHAVLSLFQAWSEERNDRSWADIRRDGPVYRWSPTICGPRLNSDREGCQPIILNADLRCDHHRPGCHCPGDLIYRHLCTCGHVDEARDCENGAAEDAMDHGWTGWRDLPILACSMPMEKGTQRDRWTETVNETYPAGWLEAGGPVRTARSNGGRRHVPGRTPHGGYDMGVPVAETYASHTYKPGLYEATLIDLIA